MITDLYVLLRATSSINLVMELITLVLVVSLIPLCFWFSYTDIKHRKIPNSLTHPIFIFVLIIRFFEPFYFWGMLPAALLLILFFINPEYVGAGDIKMLAIIGLILGINSTLLVAILMCCVLFAYMAWCKIFKKQNMVKLPLAPFITVGLLITVFITDVINYSGKLI
ncbi:prepilin peptidase [Paenibacillus woosongensis]|uniref:Prepilin type IV endopeptidase peptidase domain-containing protein n=1 Tax=Paenibacillus woosongensis TaxID=307580 RepID=A0ABQ4MYW1_9BACL|nr:A24 family peptidase [Paenibacillus woosongensis]GIP61117.1 hypothetical protein J15TS10_49310 [Paenibacillus woosongensis]